jgi:hypothetical protein
MWLRLEVRLCVMWMSCSVATLLCCAHARMGVWMSRGGSYRSVSMQDWITTMFVPWSRSDASAAGDCGACLSSRVSFWYTCGVQRGDTPLSAALEAGEWDVARWLIDELDVDVVRRPVRDITGSGVTSLCTVPAAD